VAFIDRVNAELVAPQFLDESLDRFLHITPGTIAMSRHSDNNSRWAPFLDDRSDRPVIDTFLTICDNA